METGRGGGGHAVEVLNDCIGTTLIYRQHQSATLD